ELEARVLGSGAAPLEIGVPLLGVLVLDDGGVIVLVAVLAILREAAHVADLHILKLPVLGGRGAEALEVVGVGVSGEGVLWEFAAHVALVRVVPAAGAHPVPAACW